MEKSYFAPKEIVENSINQSVGKVNMPLYKVILLGIIAGAFIAIGGQGSNVAAHAITNPGIAKTVAGVIFPVGLMLIVVIGGQLFTGNCLIFMGVLDRKISLSKFLMNLLTIFCSNYVGAALVSFLVYNSNQFNMNGGQLGAYSIYVSANKLSLSAPQAIISGIMCNIIVCAAILMAGAAKDVTGKCVGVFFTIFVFVVSGFEHCVANMYYLTAGILSAHNDKYVEKAMEVYHITEAQLQTINMKNILLHNLLPVTIGNIIGGSICIGLVFYVIYGGKEK